MFIVSSSTFGAIKAVFGLRVPDEEEDAGLDITEHGMYGYPEQFIPTAELSATVRPPVAAAAAGVPPTRRRQEAPAT